jgi:O-antigen ligase
MKSLRSLFFYMPLLLLLAVDSGSQDIGLWLRITLLALAGVVGSVLTRKYGGTGFSIFGVIALLLLLPLIKIGSVHADSELLGYGARIGLLFTWIQLSAALFRKEKSDGIQALATGAQAALLIAAFSILPSLVEAYKASNIYLANGPLFTHKNYAAASLLLLLPLALNAREEGLFGLWLQRISVGLAIACILLLRTRGVWLGAFVMTGIAVAYYAIKGNAQRRTVGMISLGVISIGIVVAIFAAGSEKIFNSDTIQSRLHYWNASWEMFMDQPVTGVGGGQWKIEYPGTGLKGTNESVMSGQTSILRPHNDLLWMLSETGIAGAVLFITLLVLGFIHTLKHERGLFFALTIVGFTVYGFGEFPLERATLLLPLATALGFAAAHTKPSIKIRPIAGVILAGLTGLFAVYVGQNRVKGERAAKDCLDGYMSGNARSMQINAQKAQNICFEMDIYNNPMAYFEGLSHMRTPNGQIPSDNKINKAEAAFNQALQIHPNHILSLNQLAAVKRYNSSIGGAIDLYERVIEIAPRNGNAAMQLMELYRVKGDIYSSLNAMKMFATKDLQWYWRNMNNKNYQPRGQAEGQRMQMLDAYRKSSVTTLKLFSGVNNPRPAVKSLHRDLQGKKPAVMWQIWLNWRQN